jgi:spoIIIJ-associated protein
MIYEDDYEFEEQPAYIRDRQIPGRSGGRGRDSGGRQRERAPRRPSVSQELPESAKPAHDLLREILERMGIAPVDIAFIGREEGEYLEVNGPDLAALIGRRGNTLEALNHIFNNIMNVGVRSNRRYYTIDAEGYRAHRAEQLKSLAFATLERCVREKKPQQLEPMLPSERKLIHLALANNDAVRTESEGEEPERRVVVFPQ